MQTEKVLKFRVAGFLAWQVEQAVVEEGVTLGELLRRALVVYFRGQPVISNVAESQKGSWEGPFRTDSGPAAAPPSSSPPSSPPAPPLTPPSLSPPALLVPPALPAGPPAALPAPDEPTEPDLPAETQSVLRFPDGRPDSRPHSRPDDPPDGPPGPPESPPPLLLFPCVADRQSGEATPQWPLSALLVAQWEETFPGMDIVGEARKAREWTLANHLKTYGGMRNYLLRWFCKAQNSGRFMRRASPRAASGPGAARSLEEVYGFLSWEEWEATLHKHFAGRELAEEIAKLGEIRTAWEAKHG